jgi:hypothetical protein
MWCKAKNSPPSCVEIKNGGTILPLPIRVNGVLLN